MLYGFIVAAWLVINLDDQAQMIPFASMSACKTAEEIVTKYVQDRPTWKSRFSCVATGVKEPKGK